MKPLQKPLKSARPDDFFRPGIDPGFSLVPGQSLATSLIPPAHISYLAPTSFPGQRLDSHRRLRNWGGWDHAVMLPTLLAVIEDACLSGTAFSIQGKYLLSGAVGHRLRRRYMIEGPVSDGVKPGPALTQWMRTNSFLTPAPLREYQGDYADLDFVVPTKNFHNFYHFTRETLHFLSLYRRFGLRGRILICGKGKEIHRFVHESVKTWYPELADRVGYVQHDGKKPWVIERGLIPFPANFLYFQCRERVMETITGVGQMVFRNPTAENMYYFSINTVESSLVDFRNDAREKIGATRHDRRIYLKRKSERYRPVIGEEVLIEKLRQIGFETVAFEDYSNLEQARLVAESEIMVSIHGANLTNMLFASANCHIVELTNLQTISGRFGDFNGLAIAANANYHHIVLDHDFTNPDDPAKVPRISTDGLRGVVLDDLACKALYSYILSLLEPEVFAELFQRGTELNKDADKSRLGAFLEQNDERLYHHVEPHVWRANVAAGKKKHDEVLQHLLHALRFAPRREKLIFRILEVAHQRGNSAAFDEALLHLRRCQPEAVAPLFAEKGWPLPEEPQQEAEEEPDPEALPILAEASASLDATGSGLISGPGGHRALARRCLDLLRRMACRLRLPTRR